YIPIPFAKGCKIVFRGDKILFHQVQFRTYDQGYSVQTYDPRLAEKSRPLLEKIVDQWRKTDRSIHDFATSNPLKVEKKITLKPGTSQGLLELNNGGRLIGIELTPAEVFSGIYKQIDLKITWDNEN